MPNKIIYSQEHTRLQLTEHHYKSAKDNGLCFVSEWNSDDSVDLHYIIGVDWVVKYETAIYVAPKINNGPQQTDFLSMLFSTLRHPDLIGHTDKLYGIKFDEPTIEIEQKLDVLTPLLVIHFLQILHSIVKKGLKKSYYKVEKNLSNMVKGKILVGENLKKNVLKNKLLKIYCSFDEFGFNGLENRLLKKALLFVQRYLAGQPHFSKDAQAVMGYCLPAFENINENIELNEIKYTKINAFYKEYEEGIRLAKLILKRFGYNIHTIDINQKVKTPPFWLDMSKLFELYVLGLLKDEYKNQIKFQEKGTFGNPDFLLVANNFKQIIDAKYKTVYQGYHKYDPDDIRQLSGYARDVGILKKLGIDKYKWSQTVVDCMFIYPDQNASENLFSNEIAEVGGFVNFFKRPIRLPECKQ